MKDKLTDEQLRTIAERKFGIQPLIDMAAELLELRAELSLYAGSRIKEKHTDSRIDHENCEDCPPKVYPTGKTRCAPCPHRATK